MRPAWLILAALLVAGPASAQPAPPAADAPATEAVDPDWPCVQRKVPSLTPAAIWTGPAVAEGSQAWRADPEIARLVGRLSQRRLPLEEATAEVATFAQSLPQDQREMRLSLLFAGLFETMNAERSTIMEGIDRYARRQKELADTIRSRNSALGSARADASADAAAIADAEQQLFWQTRIFNERRASLSTICDVPRLVEQRLFALGRAISAAL